VILVVRACHSLCRVLLLSRLSIMQLQSASWLMHLEPSAANDVQPVQTLAIFKVGQLSKTVTNADIYVLCRTYCCAEIETLYTHLLLGCIECMRSRLFLPMFAVSVCHAAEIGGDTCSVCHVLCAQGHLMQPLSNYFDHLFSFVCHLTDLTHLRTVVRQFYNITLGQY